MKIKFGTDGWRAIIDEDYTLENVARVAAATARWVNDISETPSVVVGHDCRKNGEAYAAVTAKILCEAGIKVHLAKGFVSTPMVSLGVLNMQATAGVVITASHNPPAYNGFKLKSHYGGPTVPDDIAIVESYIPDDTSIPEKSLDDYESAGLLGYPDLEEMYLDWVRLHFNMESLRSIGRRMAYDAMYGAGQNIIRALFPDATLLHCTFDPSFKGQAPEPLDRNLQELSETLQKDEDLHVGLANDGDADRIGMYDEQGQFVDAHHIILLLIHYLVKYKNMRGEVVIAFSVSDKIKKLCQHYGLEVTVTKIGFKYICGYMVDRDVLVGGEESGGIAIKGHIPERDGIWDGLTILEWMAQSGKTMSEIIEEVYAIVGAFVFERDDLQLEDARKGEIMANCKEGRYQAFGKYSIEQVEDIDGYKFHLGEERWVMIRPSGTEPLLRVYAEGRTREEVLDILQATQQTLLAG